MTLGEALGILVGVASAVLAYLAWRSSGRAVEVSQEQLELAREQAEMRPDLDIEIYIERPTKCQRPAYLVVEVTNKGKTAAHNIHGWIHMEAAKLGPYVPPPRPPSEPPSVLDYMPDLHTPASPTPAPRWGYIFDENQEPKEGFYEAQIYNRDGLQPVAVRAFRIAVGIRISGRAQIKHRVTYAEGSESPETIEVELPDMAEF